VCPLAPLNSNEPGLIAALRSSMQNSRQNRLQQFSWQKQQQPARLCQGLAEVAEWEPATQQASHVQVSTAPYHSAGAGLLDSSVCRVSCPPAPRLENDSEFYMSRFGQQLKAEAGQGDSIP
jgi:hypothetical protein